MARTARGRCGPQEIDDRRVPQSPEYPQDQRGTEGAALRAELQKGITHPSRFLEESGKQAKEDAEREDLGCKIRGEKEGKREQDNQDSDRWNEER